MWSVNLIELILRSYWKTFGCVSWPSLVLVSICTPWLFEVYPWTLTVSTQNSFSIEDPCLQSSMVCSCGGLGPCTHNGIDIIVVQQYAPPALLRASASPVRTLYSVVTHGTDGLTETADLTCA